MRASVRACGACVPHSNPPTFCFFFKICPLPARVSVVSGRAKHPFVYYSLKGGAGVFVWRDGNLTAQAEMRTHLALFVDEDENTHHQNAYVTCYSIKITE